MKYIRIEKYDGICDECMVTDDSTKPLVYVIEDDSPGPSLCSQHWQEAIAQIESLLTIVK